MQRSPRHVKTPTFRIRLKWQTVPCIPPAMTTVQQVLVLKCGLSVHFDCRRWHCGCQFATPFVIPVFRSIYSLGRVRMTARSTDSQHRLTACRSAYVRIAFGRDTFSVSRDSSFGCALSVSHTHSRTRTRSRSHQAAAKANHRRGVMHNTPFIDE